MTRLEIMTVLLSVKALLETNNEEKALEVINEVLEEARGTPRERVESLPRSSNPTA